MVEDYPSNSYNKKNAGVEKAENKKVERKIVAEGAIRRKKTLGSRFAEMFIGESEKGLVGGVTNEILIPAAKEMFLDTIDTFVDTFRQAVERSVLGEVRSTNRRNNYRPVGRTAYNHMYRSQTRNRNRVGSIEAARAVPRGGLYRLDDVILPQRHEAQEVISELCADIERFGEVNVATLFELVGLPSTHTDHNYGWYLEHIPDFRIRADPDGYRLILPRPDPL